MLIELVQKILLWMYGFSGLAIVWYAIEGMIDGWYWFRRKQHGVEVMRTLLKLLIAWFAAWVVVRIGMMTMGS